MIEMNGITYKADKMLPRQQFHIMRRLAPLLGTMGPAIAALLDSELNRDVLIGQVAAQVGPLTQALAGMDDEALDYVLDGCLGYVKRADTQGVWHAIYIPNGPGKPALRMFMDIDAMMELRLVAECIKANLSGFFVPPSGDNVSSLGAPQTTKPATPT